MKPKLNTGLLASRPVVFIVPSLKNLAKYDVDVTLLTTDSQCPRRGIAQLLKRRWRDITDRRDSEKYRRRYECDIVIIATGTNFETFLRSAGYAL